MSINLGKKQDWPSYSKENGAVHPHLKFWNVQVGSEKKDHILHPAIFHTTWINAFVCVNKFHSETKKTSVTKQEGPRNLV